MFIHGTQIVPHFTNQMTLSDFLRFFLELKVLWRHKKLTIKEFRLFPYVSVCHNGWSHPHIVMHTTSNMVYLNIWYLFVNMKWFVCPEELFLGQFFWFCFCFIFFFIIAPRSIEPWWMHSIYSRHLSMNVNFAMIFNYKNRSNFIGQNKAEQINTWRQMLMSK